MTTLDYAQVFEAEYRGSHRIRRAAARVVWAGLFIVRPALARRIWRERRG